MATKMETRSVQGFSKVYLRGYGELIVEWSEEQGAAESLVIEADDSILPRISCDVRGDRLVLGFRMLWHEWITWWFSWAFLANKGIRYRLRAHRIEELAITGSGAITCASLKAGSCRLRITGSGRIAIDTLKADSLEAIISGSGDIACAGSAESVNVEIIGSGSVRGEQLVGRNVRAGISGSGGVTVNAGDTLDARIAGSGSIRYRGSARVSTTITGSGRVLHLEEKP